MTQQTVLDQAKELMALGFTLEQIAALLTQQPQVQARKSRRLRRRGGGVAKLMLGSVTAGLPLRRIPEG